MNTRITLDNLDERVMFRFADANDIPELLYLYEMFYEEAVYKDFLDWDRARARETILNGIVTDDRPHIVAQIEDSLVGFLAYVLDRSFSTRPCQVLMEFYVRPECRRSAIGRGAPGDGRPSRAKSPTPARSMLLSPRAWSLRAPCSTCLTRPDFDNSGT